MNDTTAGGRHVAFVGLGVMGYPMAGHLANAGHSVAVFNRTAARAEQWAGDYTGRVADTPAAAAKSAELVFACVGADDDLREILHGEDGALAGMSDGAIFIDHTTDSAVVAREADEAARGQGLGFLDAPVSGGQAGAENGALTVMVGGTEESFAAAEPVMQCYSKNVTHMGSAGNGQLTKMVNQLCIAGVVQGLAEGINFAQRAGLDGERVLDVISKGARAILADGEPRLGPCSKANSNSASPPIGCARISASVSRRRRRTARSYRWPCWSINFTLMSNSAAAAAGTPPA